MSQLLSWATTGSVGRYDPRGSLPEWASVWAVSLAALAGMGATALSVFVLVFLLGAMLIRPVFMVRLQVGVSDRFRVFRV